MTQIVHLVDRQRWEAYDESDQAIGYLSYARTGDLIDLQHTVVDRAAQGRGLGGRLVEEALQHARTEGLRVRPTCPFIPHYLADHPEHEDLVEPQHQHGGEPQHEDLVESPAGVVQEVEIRDGSIRLGQLLKLAGVVPDGAMARMVIENSEVTVNGAVVARRGTHITPGQIVEYAGEAITPVHAG